MNAACLEKKGKYIFLFNKLYFYFIGIIMIEMIGEITIEDLITIIDIILIQKTEIEVGKEAEIEIEIRTRTKIEIEIKIKKRT